MGTIAGIARKSEPRAPMLLLDASEISVEAGVVGDWRGVLVSGKRNHRQVTLFERGDWDAALAQVGATAHWSGRRCNLMVDGFDLPQRPGARLRIGDVVLEVTVECNPCNRMDAVAPGLFAALIPDWRGGACTRVLHGGSIAVGDAIEAIDA